MCFVQGFNKEMEEMSRVQRSYSIPDRELRESLKRDNMEYILPKYQAFYDKWVAESVPFLSSFYFFQQREVHSPDNVMKQGMCTGGLRCKN